MNNGTITLYYLLPKYNNLLIFNIVKKSSWDNILVWITAPDRSQLQRGARNAARLREASEKPAAEEAGSGQPGHLWGIHILLPL